MKKSKRDYQSVKVITSVGFMLHVFIGLHSGQPWSSLAIEILSIVDWRDPWTQIIGESKDSWFFDDASSLYRLSVSCNEPWITTIRFSGCSLLGIFYFSFHFYSLLRNEKYTCLPGKDFLRHISEFYPAMFDLKVFVFDNSIELFNGTFRTQLVITVFEDKR